MPARVRHRRPCGVDGGRGPRLLALPAGNGAFDGVTRSPCHGDLWPDNVLVGAVGRPWVLDWDGLAVGDAAEDLATLVWPFFHSE